MRKIILSFIVIILSFSNISLANGIVSNQSLLQAEAFLDYQNGNDIILNDENIKDLNIRLAQKELSLCDLEKYPQKIDKQYLINKINSAFTIVDDYNYLDNDLINDNDKKILRDELNINNINDDIKYGVVLRRSKSSPY